MIVKRHPHRELADTNTAQSSSNDHLLEKNSSIDDDSNQAHRSLSQGFHFSNARLYSPVNESTGGGRAITPTHRHANSAGLHNLNDLVRELTARMVGEEGAAALEYEGGSSALQSLLARGDKGVGGVDVYNVANPLVRFL